MLCPRAHFKMIILDFESAYIGSANLTGAGIGMKSSNHRNFEAANTAPTQSNDIKILQEFYAEIFEICR